ncbi:MAG: hypothetical protein R3F22_05775 [Lysobacteraceae bacterium]
MKPVLAIRHLTAIAALAAATLLVAPVVAADKKDDAPSSDTVRRIERETGGRVLKVEPIHRGGRDMSRVKVLTPDGRVRVMRENRAPQPARGNAPVQRSTPPSAPPRAKSGDDGN